MEYDFSGYATKNDIQCSDGRIIRSGAFKGNDGKRVPLLWQHGHNSSANILGHALLENRSDGVYAYCKLNETQQGKDARLFIRNGDITSMSIYANQLKETSRNVTHGNIREVSLVLSGANPGALIDNIVVRHGDDEFMLDDEAIIHTGMLFEPNLEHAETETDTEDNTEEKEEDMAEKTVQDVFDSMSEEQKNVLYYMVGQALEDSSDDDAEHGEDSDDADLRHDHEGPYMHNLFENHDSEPVTKTLSHSDMESIFADAKKNGSFKEAVEMYALKHGIENIDLLFPEAKNITNTPDFVKRRTEWVSSVMGDVRKTPFSRIKSMTADLTLEEARAKGYVKGNLKREEFFAIAKRVTTPQTVYKKQKLDRDDIVDITDFDVVAWLKAEMRVMLDEEIARAILIGDGRSNADDDKIKEDHIRPIASDDDLYVTTVNVNLGDADSSAEEIVDALTLHRRHYKGSGNPTFYTTETVLARLLLAKDDIGRRLYSTVNDLAAALRVRAIQTVEVMENEEDLVGILVNLADYTVGTDKGGNVAMFDDFDIDYNQYKYLIEGRMSGALVRPKSALVVRAVAADSVLVTPQRPTFVDNTVTVATTTGVTYKNKLTDTTLTTASPVELAEGDSLIVIAIPQTGYHLATSGDDEWRFVGTAN